MNFTFDFKADHTATMNADMGEKTETGTATWEQSGNKVTITPKTKNGKPVSGDEDAKKREFTLEGGNLVFKPGEDAPFTMYLKRK
jgi:hypothetical protein